MIPSCKEIYELEKKLESERGLKDRLKIKFHLLICKNCQHLKSQLNLIQRKASEVLSNKSSEVTDEQINEMKMKAMEKFQNKNNDKTDE